jgi:hypothetical protein
MALTGYHDGVIRLALWRYQVIMMTLSGYQDAVLRLYHENIIMLSCHHDIVFIVKSWYQYHEKRCHDIPITPILWTLRYTACSLVLQTWQYPELKWSFHSISTWGRFFTNHFKTEFFLTYYLPSILPIYRTNKLNQNKHFPFLWR